MIREILKRLSLIVLGSGMRARLRADQIERNHLKVILNLHRVASFDGSAYVPLDPRIFEEMITFTLKYFRVIGIRDIDERPSVTLSFDDGYRDFIDVAVPIMKKYGVRSNHNIIPNCVETGLPPLNVMAQDFIGTAPPSLVRELDVPGFPITPGMSLGTRLSRFIKFKPMHEQETLAEYLLPQFRNWQEFIPTPMMNRDDVLEISSEHDIGVHTYSHASMKVETFEFFADDFDRCNVYFRKTFGVLPDIYAFPNNSYTIEQIEYLFSNGINHILTVGERFASHHLVKPRFNFYAADSMEMRFRSLGGLAKIQL